MNIVAPSLLSADFACLDRELAHLEQCGADWAHLDVMDGNFVPNLTFGAPVVARLRPHSKLVFDCHLMVEHPETYVASFAKAGADVLVIHAEATKHVHRALQMIKECGMKAGVALNPATSLSAVEEILPEIDVLLIMSVNPGFGGQHYISLATDKIARAKALRERTGSHALIEVDGGITDVTAEEAVKAGADVLVAGSYVFNAKDMGRAIATLKVAGLGDRV